MEHRLPPLGGLPTDGTSARHMRFSRAAINPDRSRAATRI